MKHYTRKEMLDIFRREIKKTSQAQVAVKYGLSFQYVSNLFHGRCAMSGKLASKLGYEMAWVKRIKN